MYEIIDIENGVKWDEIVKSFKYYDVQYLNNYAKAFNINGDGKPILFYFNNGLTRAVNVVMIRDISLHQNFNRNLKKNTFYDISSPYGYGGMLVVGNDYKEVYEEFDAFCKKSKFISEFVRFNLVYSNIDSFPGKIESHMHNIIRLLDIPLDEIVMDFENRLRKNLRKAQKNDFEIEFDIDGSKLDDFLDIYYHTLDRNNAKKIYYFSKLFFEEINKMKNNYIYIYVKHEGHYIASELILYGSENCYSFLGGTKKEYFELRPADILKLEIIKWAKNKGLKRFIIGGGNGSDDGIFKYKKSFAPNGVQNYYIGKRTINNDEYNRLIKIANIKNSDEVNFFPVYRMISEDSK